MRSHCYLFSARECLRVVAVPLLGVAVVAGLLHGARWLGILPPARRGDNPEETLLAYKAAVSSSRHPADVILLGDSSCATGIDAPKLRALLPGHPDVLNLALFIGFGLDVHGEILENYARQNPGDPRLVVLLVTPQFLTGENVSSGAYGSWRRLHEPEQSAAPSDRNGFSRLLGLGLMKDRLLPRLLQTPLRGGRYYGFSSDFAEYLARHEGSMLEPGLLHPPAHPHLPRYHLAPVLEQVSRDFRRRLPPGVKLAIGMTPLPESLCSREHLRTRNELLLGWNRWIQADYVLTNAPVQLPDTFFATGAHPNPMGQALYTHQVAALLRPIWTTSAARPSLAECQVRSGLPNLFSKLQAGKQVRIAYLGGSITAQEGWRPQTQRWFQSQFSAASVREINATVSGTGSDLAVFRLRRDVLDHAPDLLWIEFAVNDSAAPPDQIRRCMEGIVRQTWKANPSTDICFVYTLDGNMLEALREEKLPHSVAAMEEIGEHYGIPAINLGLSVARLEKAGKLIFVGALPGTDAKRAALGGRIVFSPDGLHPYPQTGHQLYFEAVVRSLEKMQTDGRPVPHTLPEPLLADNWETAKIEPLTRAKLSSGWRQLDPATNYLAQRFRTRLPELWNATEPGESIAFSFRGTAVSIADLVGPDCGMIVMQVDQGPLVITPRFDLNSTYHNPARLTVAEGLSNTVHRIELRIGSQPPDKARLLRQRNETGDDPKRYAGTSWYAGAIFVVGELVE